MSRKTISAVLFVLVAVAAAWVLRPPSIQSLASALVSTNDTDRNMALMRVRNLRPAQKDQLAEKLLLETKSPDWQKRRFALYALRKTEAGGKIFDAAVTLLDDPNPQVRQEAAVTLNEMGTNVAPDLIKLLPEKSGLALNGIILALTRMGKEVTPQLLPLLKDPHPAVRAKIAVAINTIDPKRTETIPVHIETLKRTPTNEDTAGAIKALVALRPKDKEIVPALTAIMKNSTDSLKNKDALRPLAASALNIFDTRRNGLVGLLWDLKGNNAELRYRAAYNLSEAPPNLGALDDLSRAMSDPDVYVRARATVAAARIGFDKSERLKPALTKKAMESLTLVKETQVEGYAETISAALKIKPPPKDEETTRLDDEPAANTP